MRLRRSFVVKGSIGIFVLTVIFQAKHFVKPKIKYGVDQSGEITKAELNASESAQVKKLTASQKAQEVLGKRDLEFDENTFDKWSILENFAAGYKLIYPAGFNIDYQLGKIEISPPSGEGRVMVYIKDGTYETRVLDEGLDKEEVDLLKATEQLVNISFEFISSPGYAKEQVLERLGE